MPQITSITSEALQATIRRLLPSQRGFGDDLQATNLIQPIIDLTPTAEGSSIPQFLQTALSVESITEFQWSNNSGTIIATPGFFRVFGTSTLNQGTSGGITENKLHIRQGGVDKFVFQHKCTDGSATNPTVLSYDFTIFLRTGDIFEGTADTNGRLQGVVQPVANQNGILINPGGFTPE